MVFWISLVLSFLIAALGQPAWVSGLGAVSACAGFALFWNAMLCLSKPKDRFLLSFGWFAVVQAVHLSWMTSTSYMGMMIFGVYLILLAGLGLQFALLSAFVKPGDPLNFRKIAAAGGFWVFMEWIRLFFLSGFTWNPTGLSLAGSEYSLQFAALLGVYGLSFWVILVNLTALKAYLEKSKKIALLWGSLALFPYLFGIFHIQFTPPASTKSLSAALVQTALFPEQKDYDNRKPDRFILPLDQWDRILAQLKGERKLDLIVLPEASLPYGAYRKLYPYQTARLFWIQHFGIESVSSLPPLEAPYAEAVEEMGMKRWNVNNLYLVQALSNQFNAHVLAGLDAEDPGTRLRYNAVFHFRPEQEKPERYEKRVLVPVGEYVPFKDIRFIARFLAENYGVTDSFQAGDQIKVFEGPLPIGVSICVEELYTGLMRDLRKSGAELFVNVSNDIWFPESRLPLQHFHHARVRAVENGVCTLRSCNSGITGAIDRFGRPGALLAPSEDSAGALHLSVLAETHKTLYTWWGDAAILALSGGSILCFLSTRKKKLP